MISQVSVVKVLLIVPNVQPGLDTVPEIRNITALHQVTVLNGTLTDREIYATAQRGNFDIIHVGAHRDTYDRDDLLQIARVANAKLVFLNACNSGKIASYLVAHGINYAISTNEELDDMQAWKFPLAFYEYLARQIHDGEVVSYPTAYGQADSGDGDYSLSVSVAHISTMTAVTRRIDGLELKVNAAIGLLVVALLIVGWLAI